MCSCFRINLLSQSMTSLTNWRSASSFAWRLKWRVASRVTRRVTHKLAQLDTGTVTRDTSRYVQKGFICLLALGFTALSTTAQELPDPLAAGWQGQDVCELLEQTDTLRVLRCTFPPGVGHERHFHAPHYGYALSGGTMKLTDARGTRVATLKTGSDFSSSGTPWHSVLNVGDTTVQYLIIEPL